MRLLDKKELLELKRNHFSSTQKTLCKKFEQTGGSFTFKVDDSGKVESLTLLQGGREMVGKKVE